MLLSMMLQPRLGLAGAEVEKILLVLLGLELLELVMRCLHFLIISWLSQLLVGRSGSLAQGLNSQLFLVQQVSKG